MGNLLAQTADDMEIKLFHRIINRIDSAAGGVVDGEQSVVAQPLFDCLKNSGKVAEIHNVGNLEHPVTGDRGVSTLDTHTGDSRRFGEDLRSILKRLRDLPGDLAFSWHKFALICLALFDDGAEECNRGASHILLRLVVNAHKDTALTALVKYRRVVLFLVLRNITDDFHTLLEELQHFGVDSTVIHNMVGADFFNQPNYFRLEGKITFVTTGRLVYGKGFDLLPKAFVKLNLPKEIWEMNIIGGGEEYDNLQKQIKELDLQDNIYLLGQKTKSQVVDILKTSDIFILPSRAENFSVAVLEALACGLPVISSDCGGIRECIFDFNGRLFPVDDVDLLADSIRHIFENYQSYDRVQIAEDCKNRFSPEVIAHQLTDVFNEIISKYK